MFLQENLSKIFNLEKYSTVPLTFVDTEIKSEVSNTKAVRVTDDVSGDELAGYFGGTNGAIFDQARDSNKIDYAEYLSNFTKYNDIKKDVHDMLKNYVYPVTNPNMPRLEYELKATLEKHVANGDICNSSVHVQEMPSGNIIADIKFREHPFSEYIAIQCELAK